MQTFNDRLLVGTYTSKKRGGIYLTEFDRTGKINIVQHIDDADDPSYLAVAPNRKFIIAANEGAKASAQVSSYRLEKDRLTLINKIHSGGDHPCYVSIHRSGKWGAAANYTGGNMVVFPIKSDGSVGNYVHEIHHSGSGKFIKRQDRPHAHCAMFVKDELYLVDLGLDKIFHYPFPAQQQMPLEHAPEKTISVTAGGGPRHLAFHPITNDMYVIEELTGYVSFFKRKNNNFVFVERVKCSDDAVSEDKGSADIHISPDGKFLYASNRAKANTLAIFKFGKTGSLQLINHISTEGEQPRNFAIHPSGKFLLIANQRTDNIVVFNRSTETGMIEKNSEISVPNPVCLKFI